MGVPAAAYAERAQARDVAGPARRPVAAPARASASATSLAFALAPPAPRDDADVSKLSATLLLEAALGMLDRAGLAHGGSISDLRAQLQADLEVQTKQDLHERAERLVRTLHRVGTAPIALAALADPKRVAQLYLPSLANRIAGHAQQTRNGYIRAIVASYMAMPDVADALLEEAESAMHGFPMFVVDAYLGPAGIEKLLKEVGELADSISELREQSGNGPRPIDQLIGLESKWARTRAEVELRQALDLARDLREGGAELDQLLEPIRSMTAQAELMVGASSALAFYELFSSYRQELQGSYVSNVLGSKPFHAALACESAFSTIVTFFEMAIGESPERARADNAAATQQLMRTAHSDDFNEALDLIHSRQETVATIKVVAKAAAVLAVAIATGGAAGWAAGELMGTLEGAAAVGAEGGALLETAGLGQAVAVRLAGTAAFTAGQRYGQEVAFGQVQGSYVGDLASNLAFGAAIEGAGAFYKSMVALGEDAGPALRALYTVGEKATELGAALGLGELEHEATEHRLMTGGEVAETLGLGIAANVIGAAATRGAAPPVEAEGVRKAKIRLARAEERTSEAKQRAELAGAREQEAASEVARSELALSRSKEAAAAASSALDAAAEERSKAEQAWKGSPEGERLEPWRAVQKARSKLTAARESAERAPRTVAAAESQVARSRETLVRRTGLAKRTAWALEDAERVLQRAKALLERRVSGTLTLAEQARQEWLSGLREGQAEELGARSGEHLHHAIELDVLDEFPGVFTAEELNRIDNMRVIPSEITTKELELLDAARSIPPEQWSPEVRTRIELRPVRTKPGEPVVEMAFLKERPAKGRPVQLHNAAIRDRWDRAYEDLERNLDRLGESGVPRTSDEARAYARRYLIDKREEIDRTLGQFFGASREEAGLRPARGSL